ncbi:hypothetical protein Esti_003919 [Eimeria stiedai]
MPYSDVCSSSSSSSHGCRRSGRSSRSPDTSSLRGSRGERGRQQGGENMSFSFDKEGKGDVKGRKTSPPRSRDRDREGVGGPPPRSDNRGPQDAAAAASRKPVGRMRGWQEGDSSSSSSKGREREEWRQLSRRRSRSRGPLSEEGAPHRSSSSSRRYEGSSKHLEEDRSRAAYKSDREERPKPQQGYSRSSSSSSISSSSRRGEKRFTSQRPSPPREGDRSGSSPSSSSSKRRREEDASTGAADRAAAAAAKAAATTADTVNEVPDVSPSLSPSNSGSREQQAAAAPLAAAAAERIKDQAETGDKPSSSSNSSSSSSSRSGADKVSRLERFKALKRQKQQPEGGASEPTEAAKHKTSSSSSRSGSSQSAFSDWLVKPPNVKFAVSSSKAAAAPDSSSSSSSSKTAAAAADRPPTSAAPRAAASAAAAAAAAAAVAAAQAVASAAMAAAGLAADSAAFGSAEQQQQQQQQHGAAETASPSESPSPGRAAAAAAGGAVASAAAGKEEQQQGEMKAPKPMSRNRLKKHQQALLLKQLQHTTSEAAPEAKGDGDLLDAFMSALEAEAKDELSAAKAEGEGHVEALGCIAGRSTDPPRPQSISIDEISRWEEVEALFLPSAAAAAAKTAAAPAAAAPAPAAAAGEASPARVKAEGEHPVAAAAPAAAATATAAQTEAAAGAAAGASSSSTSPSPSTALRVKEEAAEESAAAGAAGAAGGAVSSGPAAAEAKTDAEASTPAASAAEVDPDDSDYHQLFLETLRKGRPKGPPKGPPGSSSSPAGQHEGAGDDEEEVLLYSDHEEEEEEAAAASGGGGPQEGEGLQKQKEDDNETQAKEQLANLSYFDLVKRVGLKKELPLVDHASCKFPPVKKNLYVQVKELTDLKDHEVEAIRKTNGNIKVRGKQCPRPVSSFHQCGLPDKVLRHLELRGFDKPFPVQSQCIPILMCGRDLIAVAETGSGKTLSYALPLVRHVLSVKRQYREYLAKQKEGKLNRMQQKQQQQEQKRERSGGEDAQKAEEEDRDRYTKNEKGERMLIYGNFREGMIGLVIAPTRELSLQISREVSRLCKLVDLNVGSLYGGAGIGGQLGQIRRGVDVVVGTPGRLIDVLTLNAGRFTSLKRVTFVVLDEADRMFDFGFEPQISSILRSTRLDRQTCLFSATFPSHIESLARRILYKPIEVVVGEKGRTAAKVQQYVEVLEEERKFYRLLQLLGDWQDYGSAIIFVNKQIEADELFAELLKYGYQALVLHGGQDQTDREFTIQEFKEGTKTLLIATSVAARGLDVPSVVLVINFCCPSHIEDYVHRIGRTGRAGNIGVSYTFITAQEADKAEELEGALIQSGQPVPPALSALSAEYRVQCNMGLGQKKKRGGFGGKGFTFSITERSRQQQQLQQAKKELSGANDFDEVEEVELLLQRDDFSIPPPSGSQQPLAITNSMSTMDAAMVAASAAAAARGGGSSAASGPGSLQSAVEAAAAKAALLAKHQLAGTDTVTKTSTSSEAVARVKLVAKIIKLQDAELAKRPPATPPPPPPGLPPPGSEKTKLTIDEQVDLMLQQAVKGLPEAERAQHHEKLRESYKKHLTARPKIQQKVAPGMQLAVASSVTGQPMPKEKDAFMDAAAEALSILKQGTGSSSSQLQAALDKIKAFSDSAELAAAISSVSAPSNPTLGKVPGLSERGYVCPETGNFVDELEINDYPQVARYKLTQRELMSRIMEETGAVLYVKGQHVEPALKPRTQLAPGVKFLHVEIIAPTPIQVQRASMVVVSVVNDACGVRAALLDHVDLQHLTAKQQLRRCSENHPPNLHDFIPMRDLQLWFLCALYECGGGAEEAASPEEAKSGLLHALAGVLVSFLLFTCQIYIELPLLKLFTEFKMLLPMVIQYDVNTYLTYRSVTTKHAQTAGDLMSKPEQALPSTNGSRGRPSHAESHGLYSKGEGNQTGEKCAPQTEAENPGFYMHLGRDEWLEYLSFWLLMVCKHRGSVRSPGDQEATRVGAVRYSGVGLVASWAFAAAAKKLNSS